MPLIPVSQYASTAPYDLLRAAAHGMVPIDARLIRALLATPERTRPDLVRFAAEHNESDRLDLSLDLLYLFTKLPTPDAVPFVISELRRAPEDAPDEMVDLALALGEPLRTPALDLFDELGSEHTDIVFIALIAGARGERVDAAIDKLAAADERDGEFLRGIRDADYSDENPPSPPPEEMYPEVAEVDFAALSEAEREEFLASPDADHRASIVGFYIGEELSDRRRQQFLALGRTDPEARVRGQAWEALREHTVEPGPVREALMARFAEPGLDPVERASLACALAYEPEPVPGLAEAIETAYAEPATRAKALEAMWRSLDRRWVDRPAKHLDDEDVEVVRQALMGVGYFRLRNEAIRAEELFQHPDVRLEALHAYAMAAPADDTRFGLQQLRKRLEERADGLNETEAETVQFALELRLELAGRGGSKEIPAAAADQGAAKPSTKAGRNDPCPCGSGKKYKKCHGA